MQRLSRHPASPASVALTIEAAARRLASGDVVFRYRVEGDVRAIRAVLVPAPAAPRRADELWKHTCFEAFVQPPGSARYLELNFAPSGEWAAYEFERYRERLAPPVLPTPGIRFSADDTQLELTATVRLAPPYAARDSALGLAAVVEDSAGRTSYWALDHPRATPDFHDAAAWKGRLAAAIDESRA